MIVKKRLGEMLIEAGVIDATQLQAALGHQRKWGGRLGQALVDLKLATEPQIVEALSRKFGYQIIRLRELTPGPALEAALKLIPREFALRHNLFPVAEDGGSITVAMADPANISVTDELRFRSGRRRVSVALAGDREIAAAIRHHYFADEGRRPVEAIPLDLDAGDPMDPVLDPFGGGSSDALDQFFSQPVRPTAQGAAPAARPPPPPPAPSPPTASALVDLDDAPAGTGPDLAARADLLGTVPRGGFAVDAALDAELLEPIEGDVVLATDLAPAAEPIEAATPLSPDEQALLDALDRLVQGDPVSPEVVKPVQLVAAVVRLLLRKHVISEAELLEELGRR